VIAGSLNYGTGHEKESCLYINIITGFVCKLHVLFLYAVVSCGALGNLSDAMTLMSDVPKLVKVKNNQLEEFCSYRVKFSIAAYVMFVDKCICNGNFDGIDCNTGLSSIFGALESESWHKWNRAPSIRRRLVDEERM